MKSSYWFENETSKKQTKIKTEGRNQNEIEWNEKRNSLNSCWNSIFFFLMKKRRRKIKLSLFFWCEIERKKIDPTNQLTKLNLLDTNMCDIKSTEDCTLIDGISLVTKTQF